MSTVWIGLLVCVCVCLSVTAQPPGVLDILMPLHDDLDDQAEEEKPNLRSHKIEMQNVKIDCKVASRFAHTVMTSTALNKANISQEVFFEVELPKTAFITNFSMSVLGYFYCP